MYDPVFSNHVGIVINNQDPENRGRLQIFVPHVSNTLFADWNQGLTDKIFKSSEVNNSAFGGGVLERLKEQLPWSEVAVPAFGGGTAGPIKFTGNASSMPSYTADPLAVTPALMIINAKSQNLNNQSQPTNSVKGSDIGITSGVAGNYRDGAVLTDGNGNSYSVPAIDVRNNNADLEYVPLSDLHQSNLLAAQQYLANQPSPLDGESAGLGPAGSIPTAEQWANYMDAIAVNESTVRKGYIPINQQYAENFLNYDKTGYAISEGVFSNSVGDIGCDSSNMYNLQAQSAATARKFVALLRKDNTISGGISASYSTASKAAYTAAANNSNGTTVASSAGSVTPPSPTSSGTAQPIRLQDTLAAEAGVPHASSTGGAAGFFSRPAVGAKVWVFFYDGDVQRPVYFASVQEGTNYQVANQNLPRV
jgi:hypothetical protein